MYYDMKCQNEDCKNFDIIDTVSCSVDERDSQECPECSELLVRVYNAPALKTASDGYKS